ncbi:MAG: hypothetical protein KBT29_04710 [Prevotellaceae bacterium]|nr:hypothetical protein [Candidatus Minthosoma caballi]
MIKKLGSLRPNCKARIIFSKIAEGTKQYYPFASEIETDNNYPKLPIINPIIMAENGEIVEKVGQNCIGGGKKLIRNVNRIIIIA